MHLLSEFTSEIDTLKSTRSGRDKLRSIGWAAPEACVHCGNSIEEDSGGVWFHVDTEGTGELTQACDLPLVHMAKPHPYENDTKHGKW